MIVLFLKCFRDEKGQSLIMIAGSMVFFIVLTAFAVDIGYLFVQKRNIQNAADSAALAAAWELPGGPVQATAEEYASYHGINGGVAATEQGGGSQVRVSIVQYFPRYFGRVLGSDDYEVRAMATAEKRVAWGGIMPFCPLPGNYTHDGDCVDPILYDYDKYENDAWEYGFIDDDDLNSEHTLFMNGTNGTFVYGIEDNNEEVGPVEVAGVLQDHFDYFHTFEYLSGRSIDQWDQPYSHSYTIESPGHRHHGESFTISCPEYDGKKERLDDFKFRVKIGVTVGLLTGTSHMFGPNFGFIDLREDQTGNHAGANVIAGWIYYADQTEFDEDDFFTILETLPGGINSVFTGFNWEDGMSPIDYMIDNFDPIYVILPHPSVAHTSPFSPIGYGDYLIAEISIDPGNSGCPAPGNSAAVPYRLIGTIENVYNPLDMDDRPPLWSPGILRLTPYLIE